MSASEAELFLKKCKGERLYPLYLLTFYTGMRKGELSGLQWSDISIEKKQLTVIHNLAIISHNDIETDQPRKYDLILTTPKSAKSRRTIPLNDFVIDQLIIHKEHQNQEKEIYKDQDMVFCREDGNYINPRYVLGL